MQEVLMQEDKPPRESQEGKPAASPEPTGETGTGGETPDQVKPKDKRVWILKSRLAALEKDSQQAQFYLDHLQRLQAEFENYRKRSAKEREEYRKFLLEDFVLELIGILDNFERALESVRANHDLQSLQTGVELISRQFQDCLSRRGVTAIEALGQPFDPARHDAICFEDSKDHPAHQVIGEMAKGYCLHGKVIRPSKVKVAQEPPPPTQDQARS